MARERSGWAEVLISSSIAAVAVFGSAFITGACYLFWGRRKARIAEAEYEEYRRELATRDPAAVSRGRPHLVLAPSAEEEPLVQLGEREGEEVTRSL